MKTDDAKIRWRRLGRGREEVWQGWWGEIKVVERGGYGFKGGGGEDGQKVMKKRKRKIGKTYWLGLGRKGLGRKSRENDKIMRKRRREDPVREVERRGGGKWMGVESGWEWRRRAVSICRSRPRDE